MAVAGDLECAAVAPDTNRARVATDAWCMAVAGDLKCVAMVADTKRARVATDTEWERVATEP